MRGQQVMEPIEPRTREDGGRIILALDNGVRIECGGPDGPGHYMLVANAAGVEIGYWNTEELSNPEVLAEVMICAASGKPPCEHKWVDATNEVIESGFYCSKCGRMKGC